MESSDGGDTSDSFLDDRAVSELSECPTSDAGSEPDDAPCVKRRRTDSEDSADEYAPVRVARGLWGCVVVVGLAAPADVRVLVLRDDPGDAAVAALDHAMAADYPHPHVRAALALLGLVDRDGVRALPGVQSVPLPPLAPCHVFVVNCMAQSKDCA